jgi:hypothetical protein
LIFREYRTISRIFYIFFLPKVNNLLEEGMMLLAPNAVQYGCYYSGGSDSIIPSSRRLLTFGKKKI